MAGRPLLCVLLDINLFSWASFLSAAEFSQVIRNLMAFMNVFQSISEDCHLALFTVDSGECGLIYTNELEHERPVPADTRNDAMYFKFGALQSVLKNVLVKHESRDRSMTSKISSALSCCLSCKCITYQAFYSSLLRFVSRHQSNFVDAKTGNI